PGHPTGARFVLNIDSEERRVLSDQAVIAPTALDLPGRAYSVPEPLVLARRMRIPQQADQVCEFRLFDRSQPHWPLHGASFARPTLAPTAGCGYVAMSKVEPSGQRSFDE